MYSGWLHLNEVVSANGEGEVAVTAAAASVVNAGVVVGSTNAGAAEITGVEGTAVSVKTCSTAAVVDDTTTASVFEGFEMAEIAGVVVSITAAKFPVKEWPPCPV